MTVLLAALAAAAAATIRVRGSGRRRVVGPVRAGRAAAVSCAACTVVGCALAGVSAAAVATVGTAATTGYLLVRRRMRTRQVAARRRETVIATFALGAELRAGRSPGQALDAVAGQLPMLGPAIAAAARAVDAGGDLAAALAGAAAAQGADRLRVIAAVWGVAVDAGARAADLLDGVAAAFDSEDAAAHELASVAAGPRATALLLAVLPVAGLGLGSVMGASPWHLLAQTRAGAVLVAAAAALDAGGLFWMHRLTRV